jgi:DNA-directed RNA polymerase specialized sigma24 family protein
LAESQPTPVPEGPQYPYLPGAPADVERITAAASQVLEGIQPMLRRMAMNLTSQNDVEDLVQRCMLSLWEKSLPRYDAWRVPKTKVTSFLHRCALMFMYQDARRRVAARRKHLKAFPCTRKPGHGRDAIRDSHMDDVAMPDQTIERIALHVLDNLEQYFTRSQVRAMRAVQANPQALHREVARMLGYRSPSSVSMILTRMRTRLRNFDLEHLRDDLST